MENQNKYEVCQSLYCTCVHDPSILYYQLIILFINMLYIRTIPTTFHSAVSHLESCKPVNSKSLFSYFNYKIVSQRLTY